MLCHGIDAVCKMACSWMMMFPTLVPASIERLEQVKRFGYCEKQWFYLSWILILCDSFHVFHPDFGLVQSLKDLHRYHSAPPSGVASTKNALFGVSCTYQNMFLEIKSKLRTARIEEIVWDLVCSLRAVCVFYFAGHHNSAITNASSRNGGEGSLQTTRLWDLLVMNVRFQLSQKKMVDSQRFLTQFITISSISSVVSKSIPHFRQQV